VLARYWEHIRALQFGKLGAPMAANGWRTKGFLSPSETGHDCFPSNRRERNTLCHRFNASGGRSRVLFEFRPFRDLKRKTPRVVSDPGQRTAPTAATRISRVGPTCVVRQRCAVGPLLMHQVMANGNRRRDVRPGSRVRWRRPGGLFFQADRHARDHAIRFGANSR